MTGSVLQAAGTLPEYFLGLSYDKVEFSGEPLFTPANSSLAALFNLLGNALKFSKSGMPPVIHVSCKILTAGEAPGHLTLNAGTSYCDITFQDNGIGIDEKFTEQIFMMFQRLNARTDFEGTGIGLALCKKIVLGHQGEIYVTSIPGEGSQFHVLLPLDQ